MVQPGLNTHPGPWAPAPKSVTGVGSATCVLAFVTSFTWMLLAAAELRALKNGGAMSEVPYNPDTLVGLAEIVNGACTTATTVLIIVWMYQARQNAELICAAEHRHARGWVIGGWFCPVVNLWFPAAIVADIYRASMPSTRHDRVSFDGMPGVTLVWFWWTPFLLSGVVMFLGGMGDETADGLRAEVTTTAFGAMLDGAAAIALAMIISRVSAWQLQPKTA